MTCIPGQNKRDANWFINFLKDRKCTSWELSKTDVHETFAAVQGWFSRNFISIDFMMMCFRSIIIQSCELHGNLFAHGVTHCKIQAVKMKFVAARLNWNKGHCFLFFIIIIFFFYIAGVHFHLHGRCMRIKRV